MKIIIDTREQAPLTFKHKEVKEAVKGMLKVGDYAVMFGDDVFPVHFERKSLNDLYGTLSQGYTRFRKEIDRAKEMNVRLIIIVEGSLTRVLHGVGYSQRTPESIVYQIFTIYARHGVETVFCNNRDEVAEYITQFFLAHYKQYQEKLIKQGDGNDRKKPEVQTDSLPA